MVAIRILVVVNNVTSLVFQLFSQIMGAIRILVVVEYVTSLVLLIIYLIFNNFNLFLHIRCFGGKSYL